MAYESPSDLAAVRRGERASDPQGYGTAFEVQQRRNDGETPDSQTQKEPFWWNGLIGFALIGAALAVGFHFMRKEKEQ